MHLLKNHILATVILLLSLPLSAEIVINEIMYNSPGTDVEFVELYNDGQSAVNLDGWYLLDSDPTHPPCVLEWTLEAGQYLVVCADLSLFALVYPEVDNLNPNAFNPSGTGFSLGNAGDEVNLFNAVDDLRDFVAYDDGGDWPGSPDGDGPSLELINPLLDNSLPTSWDPSVVDGGTPGELNSAFAENAFPICKDGSRDVPLPGSSDAVTVSVLAHDAEGLASVQLFVDTGSGFLAMDMFDDGIHGDGAANDSIFGAVIPAQVSGTLVRYYAEAFDDIGQSDLWPNGAPAEYHAYTVGHLAPVLRITELMASNTSTQADEYGGYDDWFEIHNPGDQAVNLSGMFVSDDLENERKSPLPPVILNPGDDLLFWADNEPGQGPYHCNFKFSASGESVGIFDTVDHGNTMIHGWSYGLMASDVSMGFNSPVATAPEYLALASPGAGNEGVEPFSAVCINEFHTSSAFGGQDDWVELFNRGNEMLDLSGFLLSDELGILSKWSFPPGSTLDPGEFLVVYEDALGFGFSSNGTEVIMLSSPDSLLGLDYYDFGPQSQDISEGRFSDGDPVWQFFTEPSPGTANIGGVGVEETVFAAAPLRILGNFPNPFNPRTEIHFEISRSSEVTLQVFSAEGRALRHLECGRMEAGRHIIAWNGLDDGGHSMPSGVYFVRIQAAKQISVAKMTLLK
jgi:hypothetical protein